MPETNEPTEPVQPAQSAQPVISLTVQHQPVVAEPSNGMAIASMIIGIVSVLTCFTVFGFLAAVTALVFGLIGLKHKKNKGMAIAGICTSGFALVIGVILFFIGFAIGFAGSFS